MSELGRAKAFSTAGARDSARIKHRVYKRRGRAEPQLNPTTWSPGGMNAPAFCVNVRAG